VNLIFLKNNFPTNLKTYAMYSMKLQSLLNQTTRKFAGVFMGIVLSLATFTQLSAQLSVSVVATDPTCAGYTNGTAVATATGGVAPYTYRWSNGTTGNSLSGLGAGTYGVTVTGANNATATGSGIITMPTPIVVTSSLANICAGGSVSVSATGGTGPYTYNWGGGRVGATQATLPAAGYNVTVTDARGCSVTKFVNVPAPFTAGLRIGELVCFGDCDAAIDALPTGGTGPYTFRWNTGATTGFIIGIPSGTYSVTITDANGCTSNASGTVANPPSVTLTTTQVAPTCSGNNGSATVTATGGRPPFGFRWSNGQTGATVTGLGVGTYFVTATDAKGCNKTAQVVLTSNAGFTVNATATNASCGGSNGSATATPTGTGPFTYIWSTGATTQTISNLTAGGYTVTVSNASGCAVVATTNVNAAGSLGITMSGTNAACGIANGTATATPTSGTAPFRYAWNTGATTQTIGVLAAGTYTVTVTDASGCTAIGQQAVAQTSSFDVTLDARAVNCNGGTDGQATAMVMGGSAPYTYRWSNGGTTQVLVNLGAGNYTVTVTDASGCTAIKTAAIAQPSALTASIASTGTSCSAASGSATVTPGGGTAPYSFAWSNAATSASISNLGAGVYTVSVTDAKGCRSTASATIAAATTLDATANVTNVRCAGTSTGAVTLTASGSTGTVTYVWSNGATTASLSNVAAGTYSVTINDSRNCAVVKQYTVSQPAAFTASVSGNMTSCGASNGMATANTAGGNGPFTYRWSNNATTSSITGLGAGIYGVTVTDANGCTAASSITITPSTALNVTVSATAARCNGAANGSANSNVSGGTAPYTYAWSNGATTSTLSNVAAGSYSLVVTDAVGCSSASQTATVSQPTAISTTLTVSNAACGNTGSIASVSTGGSGTFTYLWNTGATTATISNLAGGTYTLTITDGSGCTKVMSSTVNAVAGPAVTLTSVNPTCNGGNNGSVTTAVSGGSVPYTYAWSNGTTGASIANATAGTYSVTITDATGCAATGVRTTTLTQPSAIVITPTVTNATCLPVGSVSVVPSGGNGAPYTYSWSTGATTASISSMAGGNYTVTVTDVNGCRNSATINVPAVTSPNFACTVMATSPIQFQGGTGELTVTATNGRAPYTYRWSNGSTLATASGLVAGTYTVTVTDANGCTTTASFTLTQPTCSNLTSAGTISGNQNFCNASELTGITETSPAVGGTGAIEYLWMYSTTATTFSQGGNWTTIQGATGKDLPLALMPAISQKTNFIRCTRRAGCFDYLETNIISKTPAVTMTWIAERAPCLNRVNTFVAADNGAGATYSWTFPSGANITSSSSRSVNVTFTSLGEKTAILTITQNGCIQTRTLPITVVNCAGQFGSISAFSASTTNTNGIRLNWATALENSPSKYMVEKSVDNVNFTLIATVNSQNLPNNLYTFNDPQPKMGRAFYRIHHMTTLDQDIALSKTERVVMIQDGQALVTYPNPVGAILFVEVVDTDNSEGVIEIYSEAGILVKVQKFTANQVRYEVDTNSLGKGNYILKVRKADGTVTSSKISKF
jgi:hypothetical protein